MEREARLQRSVSFYQEVCRAGPVGGRIHKTKLNFFKAFECIFHRLITRGLENKF